VGFRRAFSLIELVIVVVIIGAVAAIAMPRVTSLSDRAKAGACASHLLRVASAYQTYHAEHGVWPHHDHPFAFPAAMAGRLTERDFYLPSAVSPLAAFSMLDVPIDDPIRGRYIAIAAFDSELVQRIDALIDDGDVLSGQFVRLDSQNGISGTGYFAMLRLSRD
jgi:prepilin-type N-terminal cleavage/methylation domain-containing protein